MLKVKHHCIVTLTLKYSLYICTVDFVINAPMLPLSLTYKSLNGMELTICLHMCSFNGLLKMWRRQSAFSCLRIWRILDKGTRYSMAHVFSSTPSRYVGIGSLGRVWLMPNFMMFQSKASTSHVFLEVGADTKGNSGSKKARFGELTLYSLANRTRTERDTNLPIFENVNITEWEHYLVCWARISPAFLPRNATVNCCQNRKQF